MNKMKSDQIKAMLDAGFDTKDIMKNLGVKEVEIIKIASVDTDDVPIVEEKKMKKETKKSAKKETNKATKKLDKDEIFEYILVELRSIADSLERIAEAQEKKRGLFHK